MWWSAFVYLVSVLMLTIWTRKIWRLGGSIMRRCIASLALIGILSICSAMVLTARGLLFQSGAPAAAEHRLTAIEDSVATNRLAVSGLDQRLTDTNKRIDALDVKQDVMNDTLIRMDAKLSLLGELFFGGMIPMLVVLIDVLKRWTRKAPEAKA